MSLWTRAFWRATVERSVKTFSQTLAALLVADGTGLLDSAWIPRLSVAGMAGLVSVLTSIGSDAASGHGPSLTNAEVVPSEVVAVVESAPIPGTTLPVGYDGHGAPIHDDGYDAKHDRP